MSLVLPTFSGFVQPASGGAYENLLSGSFDGTDDKLSIPTNTFNLGDGLFSFSLWFNADSLNSYNVLFAVGKASGSTFRCTGWIRDNGDIALSNWSNDQLTSSGNTIATSTWHHLAYVKSTTGAAGTITIYFNGSSVASGPIPSTGSDFGSENEASAIGDSITGYYTFDGKIDEFAFWNSALSASDITAIYNSGVPADISSLSPVNWYRMGDGTGDTESGGGAPASGDTIGTVVNQGSGSNNATGTNGPTYSDSVPS